MNMKMTKMIMKMKMKMKMNMQMKMNMKMIVVPADSFAFIPPAAFRHLGRTSRSMARDGASASPAGAGGGRGAHPRAGELLARTGDPRPPTADSPAAAGWAGKAPR